MEPIINPNNSQGEKNIFCPHYRFCLDYAAHHRWESFDCSNCEYKELTEDVPMLMCSPHDPDVCYSLSNDISDKIPL